MTNPTTRRRFATRSDIAVTVAAGAVACALLLFASGCGDSPTAPEPVSSLATASVVVDSDGALQFETTSTGVLADTTGSRNVAHGGAYAITLSATSGSSVRVTHVNPSAWAAISATGEVLSRLNHNRRSVRCTYTGGWRRFDGRLCSDVDWGHGWPNNNDGSLNQPRFVIWTGSEWMTAHMNSDGTWGQQTAMTADELDYGYPKFRTDARGGSQAWYTTETGNVGRGRPTNRGRLHGPWIFDCRGHEGAVTITGETRDGGSRHTATAGFTCS